MSKQNQSKAAADLDFDEGVNLTSTLVMDTEIERTKTELLAYLSIAFERIMEDLQHPENAANPEEATAMAELAIGAFESRHEVSLTVSLLPRELLNILEDMTLNPKKEDKLLN